MLRKRHRRHKANKLQMSSAKSRTEKKIYDERDPLMDVMKERRRRRSQRR